MTSVRPVGHDFADVRQAPVGGRAADGLVPKRYLRVVGRLKVHDQQVLIRRLERGHVGPARGVAAGGNAVAEKHDAERPPAFEPFQCPWQAAAGKSGHGAGPSIAGMFVTHQGLHVVILMPAAKKDLALAIAVRQHERLRLGRTPQPLRRLERDSRPGRQRNLSRAGLPNVVPAFHVNRQTRRAANRQNLRGPKKNRGVGAIRRVVLDE